MLRSTIAPLLAYIGGPPAHFTSKDHNVFPGETVEKQIIIINNSRSSVAAVCRWSLDLPEPVTGTRELEAGCRRVNRNAFP